MLLDRKTTVLSLILLLLFLAPPVNAIDILKIKPSSQWDSSAWADYAKDLEKDDPLHAAHAYEQAIDELYGEYSNKKEDSALYSRLILYQNGVAKNYHDANQQQYQGTMKDWSNRERQASGFADAAAADYTEAKSQERTGSSCLMSATAHLGSPQAEKIQIVRDYRDGMIKQTYIGSRFIIAFNAWYYSFSPAVAGYIETHPIALRIMQVCLIPLLYIISLSQNLSAFLSFSPEVATVIVLIFGGAMYGLVYISPLMFIIVYSVGRKGRKIPVIRSMKPVFMLWIFILAAVYAGTFFALNILTVITTGLLVAITVILVAGCASFGLYEYISKSRSAY